MVRPYIPPAGWRGFFAFGLAFWQLNLFFWGLYGLLALIFRLALGQPPAQALLATLLLEGTCLLLSLVLRLIYRSARREFGLLAGLLVMGCSLGAALLQGLAAMGYTWFMAGQNPMADFFAGPILRVLIMWATFMLWSLGFYWLWAETERAIESNRRAEAQREAQRMELQMLRAQLDPHFLFNSLNGIAAEIRPHPQNAIAMVGELSGYLRYSLDHRKKPIARLSTELDAMEAYLRIERARFGERLHYSVEVPEEARARLVPGFLLQPLVENAVKHGLESSTDGLRIELRGEVHGDLLTIRVSNSGSLAPREGTSGIGLETLRRRLDLHYPQRHAFTLTEHAGNVVAELQLRGTPCSA